MSPFDDFPREGISFLAELRRHNERAWFTAHRDTYERCLLEPARDLVEAVGAELPVFGAGMHSLVDG